MTIGAAVQLYRLEAEPRIKEGYTALHEAVCGLGSTQVRNMATLAGNLCNLIHDQAAEAAVVAGAFFGAPRHGDHRGNLEIGSPRLGL